MRNQAPSIGGIRIKRFFSILLLLIAIFLTQLIRYQLVDAPALNKVSFDKRSVTNVVPAIRGRILDSAGNILAETVYYYDINIDPSIVGPFGRKLNGQDTEISVEQAKTELSGVLKVDESEIATKMLGKSRYANLKKAVDPATYRAVKALDIPWVFSDPIPHRIYPNGAVAGNLLGFVGKDGQALEGLEITMNSCLAGQDGKEVYEKGVDGIKIPASTQTTKAAKPGQDLVLTINSDLQYYAQQVMTKYVKKEKAEWGSAVVIEAATGKILAAAEAPTVDPNVYWKADAADRGARIFQETFEPGSTLKTVTAATLLDQGKADPLTQVMAPYNLKVLHGTESIQDSHLHGNEKLTLTGVLAESSNTGIVQLGSKVSAQTRYEYYKKFGLGARTGVNFTGEGSGILHSPDQTDKLSQLTEMFGQAMSVTPIQTAMIYQTIANKGTRLSPILVEGCKDASGKLVPSTVPAPVKVMSPKAARSTVDMLENVVLSGGIGKTAKIPGYRVGGKTGTAQIKTGSRYGNRFAISFIGMVP
ncbi:MAG: hypothetical protein RL556_715, partial [Actinomycetota bacterium]